MIREVPYTSTVVSDIVQRFIRDIGLPTIERFDRCFRLLWNLPPYSGPIPAPYSMQTTSPIASPPGSSVFTYYGKKNLATVVDFDSDDDDTPQSTGFKTEFIAPRTPVNTRTIPQRTMSSRSSKKTLTRYNFTSPTGTPSRHKSGPSNSLSPGGAGSSQAPVTAIPENHYAAFIDENGLTEFYPSIDLVRRRVVMFNWKDELLNLGIDEDLVADLMSAMNSYSETVRN
jgi:hypothetical protein